MFGLVLPQQVAAQETSFTLRPGGVATISFVAYCTEFGKFFPTVIVEPNGVAPDEVRAALAYIKQQGYSADPQQALEANFAIWQLAGFSRATNSGPVTDAVKQAATRVPADPSGTSILDAASAGQVTLRLVSWQPIGDKVQILSATDHFYGSGTLTVQNVSTQDLTLFMPVGTLFPATETRFQTMGGYQTDVQVQNPGLPATGSAEERTVMLLLVALVVLVAGTLIRSGRRVLH
jgi:hypothetical protein